MAAQNLGRRLIKELKRGGKKTIVLGVLLLGGACTWGPQLWRLIVSRNAESVPSQAGGQPAPPTAGNMPAAASSAATPASDWKSLQSRLENASLAQPETFNELVRDPFDRDWIRELDAQKRVPSEQAVATSADPLHDLVCSSTLVGPQFRAAIIGDKLYQIGQKVPRDGPIQYVLKDVLPDRVLLERDGKVTPLEIPRPALDTVLEDQR